MTSKIVDPCSTSSIKFNWKIDNFSELNSYQGHGSDIFQVGGFKWTVRIYPKGCGKVYEDLTLALKPIKLTKSVHAEFSLAVTSQTYPCNTKKLEGKYDFPKDFTDAWGWTKFMRLSELHDPEKGYLVNDTCVISVEVSCRVEDTEDEWSDAWEENTKDDEDQNTKDDEDEWSDASEENIKDDEDQGYASINNPNQVAKTEDEKTGAGQSFGEGQPNNKVGFCEDKEFEDVGGFSILKTQAPLYRRIWLKYGHIPSTKVMPIRSYQVLVMVVRELMCCITDMHKCHYVDLSSEMVDRWEGMITMAEKFEFNIGWLRERFDQQVRKGMCEMQIFKTELVEHGQGLRSTKSKMRVLRNVMAKAEAELNVEEEEVREKISGLLSESDIETYLEIGEDLLLDGLLDGVY